MLTQQQCDELKNLFLSELMDIFMEYNTHGKLAIIEAENEIKKALAHPRGIIYDAFSDISEVFRFIDEDLCEFEDYEEGERSILQKIGEIKGHIRTSYTEAWEIVTYEIERLAWDRLKERLRDGRVTEEEKKEIAKEFDVIKNMIKKGRSKKASANLENVIEARDIFKNAAFRAARLHTKIIGI